MVVTNLEFFSYFGFTNASNKFHQVIGPIDAFHELDRSHTMSTFSNTSKDTVGFIGATSIRFTATILPSFQFASVYGSPFSGEGICDSRGTPTWKDLQRGPERKPRSQQVIHEMSGPGFAWTNVSIVDFATRLYRARVS
jgi:hypothetical protein